MFPHNQMKLLVARHGETRFNAEGRYLGAFGETIAEVASRVVGGLRQMYEGHRHKVVVLVAHGFVAKVVRAVAGAGFDDVFEWQLANGTVCELALTANPSVERPPWPPLERLCLGR